jgi:hypothetical protein
MSQKRLRYAKPPLGRKLANGFLDQNGSLRAQGRRKRRGPRAKEADRKGRARESAEMPTRSRRERSAIVASAPALVPEPGQDAAYGDGNVVCFFRSLTSSRRGDDVRLQRRRTSTKAPCIRLAFALKKTADDEPDRRAGQAVS